MEKSFHQMKRQLHIGGPAAVPRAWGIAGVTAKARIATLQTADSGKGLFIHCPLSVYVLSLRVVLRVRADVDAFTFL